MENKLSMKGIQTGKFQIGGFRLKGWAIGIALAIMGVGNAIAAVAEWYDSIGMLFFNGVCVVALIVAVLIKVFSLEPRKKWRILSFLTPGAGVAALFCGRIIDSSNSYPQWVAPLLIVGGVLILLGIICIVRWRRASLAHKDYLKQQREL